MMYQQCLYIWMTVLFLAVSADDKFLDGLLDQLTREASGRSQMPDCDDEFPRAKCIRVDGTDCSSANGWGESTETWRCTHHDGTSVESKCKRQCFTRSPADLPDCRQLLLQTPPCTFKRTTPCSKTCGIGKLVQKFICSDEVKFCQMKCCCGCCCSKDPDTEIRGPVREVRCSDPGVWVTPMYRSSYCSGYPAYFGRRTRRRALRDTISDLIEENCDE